MRFNSIIKKVSLLASLFSVFCLTDTQAQVNAPGQVWQWAIDVQGAVNANGQPRAYMWIPPNCTKVKAMMLAQNNMEELSILENQQFRDSLASIDMGEIWISPNFDLNFNFQNGAGEIYLQMAKDLASVSGYSELINVPVVPIGHSASANFPFAFAAWSNERTLCTVSVSGMAPYDFTNQFGQNFWCGRRVDYIPHLTCMGEFEGAGDYNNSTWTKIYNRIDTNQYTPFCFLPISGEYHFATSQRKTNFIAYFIKKAMQYRMAEPATDSKLAVLNQINPMTTGWRVDRWQKDMLPRYAPAPVASYTGIRRESYWCFDQDMALRIEDFKSTYFRKTPCLIAYNQSTTPGVVGTKVPQTNNHVQCTLSFIPLNDSLDFELSSSFLDSIPAVSGRCAGWMSTTNPSTGVVTNGTVGARIGHPADNSLSVIDRELGPIAKLGVDPATGITKFRMSMERGLGTGLTNYQQYWIFSVAHPGDATYKASVLQADMSVNVYNTSGLAQTITFPQIANVANVSAGPVTLNATSSMGMPVQYFIEEGPAQLQGNKVVFTKIPKSAKYPVKVTVTAWQWGRNAALATRLGASQVQTAPQVKNTFYILSNVQPVIDLNKIEATLVNSSLVNVSWKTNTEVNTSSFVVEKSPDNTTWVTLGTVTSAGAGSSYLYSDTNPVDGINYYRLKVISSDESYVYSEVVSVSKGIATSIKKPATEVLSLVKVGNVIEVTGAKPNAEMTLSLTDASGKVLFIKQEVASSLGTAQVKLPILATGVYMVNVNSDKKAKTLKIVND
ncbi:T9SS type A sorting domain-containing protein [Parabacteroides sp. FAFU027]|uniref:T9SS type A sorting domain-containing protein n=1 Tax=Parabacteroides sp. FAFU027 TaxID=2922715 RepID=UPI001FAFCACC|nr:T9SS type A sorting domain-containing protein [Parabacteroides sp. FAFU027]